jgi:N-acetylmuramoyl-L-alanine amidase
MGGGAVFCTFLTTLDREVALAARTGDANRRQPLVVVDPGHGGRDPGATGAAGTLEKNVTLASAVALKSALEARGRYRVELTRVRDQFVHPLDRVDIALELGASLFLSMHADRLSNASIRGASVYTLAKNASDAETEALAQRENGLVPGGDRHPTRITPEVSEILASLAARHTRAASVRVAHAIVHDIQRDLPVLPTPERHANFAVLHTAGIPSVLIEMGFLSNLADEAALNDAAHRDLIAHAVTRAIDAWFAATPSTGPT